MEQLFVKKLYHNHQNNMLLHNLNKKDSTILYETLHSNESIEYGIKNTETKQTKIY